MSLNSIFEESKYIIVQGERIFIDICEHGCGSGCLYCYAPYHNDEQKLLKENQIHLICKYIQQNYDCSKNIISLCPNTEPLKSEKSINLVLYIIKFFTAMGCYIQISTKERVPTYFLEEIHNLSESNIYINISIPIIENSKIVEPYAASIEERFENFAMKTLYPNINFCLYIKPFIMKKHEQNLYVEYIKRYQIGTVFIGATFDNDSTVPCISLYDKVKAKKMYNKQIESINKFIELLRANTKAKVYGSSICCIYDQFYTKCALELFDYSKQICKDCALKKEVTIV